jgi:putative membrane-bound dehydrogenase-like protein
MNLLLLIATLFLQQAEGSDLLDAVNSERGGRHWIDQEPDPPKSPDESRACFQVESGSRIELVAAEPLVFDPVWIDFDHRGRMFVTEYTDYPIGPVKEDGTVDESASPLSKIVLLEDTDADGRMDRRTVFADKLDFCHSFMPLMDGILACTQTEILFLKDTNADNIADVREVWYDGFTPAHPQMQIGCPRWGMDNWIYLTYAPGNVTCRRPGFETSEPVKMPRQDMRFNPRTMEFQPVSGLGQFGNTVDNDGHRFFCTNRNPIMMQMIPQEAATHNPLVSIGRRHTDVGPSGGDTRVFPLVAMKSNWLAHAGTHTSACGVTAYRGDLWNSDFQHSVFACEPVGHLVTRSIVTRQANSPALTAERAQPDADFLASTDTWFRPASLRTGPDGALYLADMYRMWVEHPKFLPPEIAARINWRAGEDRGRIWRIVPDDSTHKPTAFVAAQTSQQLVEMLKDTNGWRRQNAQRAIVESTDASITGLIRQLLRLEGTPDHALIHALWCLHGRDELTPDDVAQASNSTSNEGIGKLQKQLLAMCTGSQCLPTAMAAADSDDSALRLQALLSLATINDQKHAEETLQVIRKAVSHDINQPWLADAVLITANEHSLPLLNQIVEAAVSRQTSDTGAVTNSQYPSSLVLRLAELLGKTGSDQQLVAALGDAVKAETSARWVTVAILKGLASGIPRNTYGLESKSLAAFLQNAPDSSAKTCQQVVALLDRMTSDALDRSQSVADRIAAVEMLALRSPQEIIAVADRLLSPGESSEVQQAAIDVARRSPDAAADIILERWGILSPAIRSSALSLLLARPETTVSLLNTMQSGRIPSSVIDIDQRVRMLQHRDERIRKLAGEVFGGVVSANRREVADQYHEAITMKASAERGAAVFEKTCSKCHRIDGKGHNVGPDISDTRNRSRDALLYDILDPNRRVDPQFSEYIVVTTDGRTFNGLLVSDSAQEIVLRQPEGREQSIVRSDIDEMVATSKSLMPEGVEKDVTIQQMADLLEFLKAR